MKLALLIMLLFSCQCYATETRLTDKFGNTTGYIKSNGYGTTLRDSKGNTTGYIDKFRGGEYLIRDAEGNTTGSFNDPSVLDPRR